MQVARHSLSSNLTAVPGRSATTALELVTSTVIFPAALLWQTAFRGSRADILCASGLRCGPTNTRVSTKAILRLFTPSRTSRQGLWQTALCLVTHSLVSCSVCLIVQP